MAWYDFSVHLPDIANTADIREQMASQLMRMGATAVSVEKRQSLDVPGLDGTPRSAEKWLADKRAQRA